MLRVAGPCPCPFHRNHDDVVLAKTFLRSDVLPSPSTVHRVWLSYIGVTSPRMNLTWTRVNTSLVSKLLSLHCGCLQKDTYRYVLPAVLLWDLMHPTSKEAEFKVVSVSGECAAGLVDGDRHVPLKKRAVLEWSVMCKVNVCSELLRTLSEMPRAKRSVSKYTAMQFCPCLVEAYCETALINAIKRNKKEKHHLDDMARVIYCDSWGFPCLPTSATSVLKKLVSATNEQPKKKQRNLHSFFEVRGD